MSELSLIEKLILDELGGKNQAIHACDTMMWTVRTGFLTLFFAGWGILLKAFLDSRSSPVPGVDNRILVVMLLLSVALGVGGMGVDQNYARRKHRVIHAMDQLMSKIVEMRGHVLDGLDKVGPFLQISGDKNDKSYEASTGYNREKVDGWLIFLPPMVMAALAVCLLWS